MPSNAMYGTAHKPGIPIARDAFVLHGGVVHGPQDLIHAWSAEPLVIVPLAVVAVAYARGLANLTRRRPPMDQWRARAFVLGWIALGVALLSPVDALGDALFSAHMVQHLLLTMVAAPLLVRGDAVLMMLWSLPQDGRRRVGRVLQHRAVRNARRWLSHPLTAWSLHAAALVFWHVPAPYELAVRHELVHGAEHLSFFLTAVVFWRTVVEPRARVGVGVSLFYLFSAAVASAIVGAIVTMADVPWYDVHAATAPVWGLSPLEDQQIAGLIMWIPAGVIYLAALVPVCLRALTDSRQYASVLTRRE